MAEAGGEHSLVETKDGRVWSAGACGLGWCRAKDMVKELFGWREVKLPEPVVSTIASFYHNLAIGRSGKLWAWGCGTFTDGKNDGVIPALGPCTLEDLGAAPHIVPLPGGQLPTSLAAGAYHSVVLTKDKEVLTFGAAQLGQLGRAARG